MGQVRESDDWTCLESYIMGVLNFADTPEGKSIASSGRHLLLQYGVIHGLFAEVVSIKLVGQALNVTDEEFAFCHGLFHYSSYYSLLEIAKIVEFSEQTNSLWKGAQKLRKNVKSVQRHQTPFGGSIDNLDPALDHFINFLESDLDIQRIKHARDKIIAHADARYSRSETDIELTSFEDISRIITKIGELIGFIGVLTGQVSKEDFGDQVFLYYENFNRLGVVSCSHLAFSRCNHPDSFSLLKLQIDLIQILAGVDIAQHPLTPKTNLYELAFQFLHPLTSTDEI